MELTTSELDVAKEIVNIALAKAADSLAFFIKQKVFINTSALTFYNVNEDAKFCSLDGKEITVLKTEIKGDFVGNCYLLFNESDKNKVLELTLSPNILESEEKKKEFGDAILLEIDNIITASVVTQFSNLLGFKMHGHVPAIYQISKEDIDQFLYKENENLNVILNIKTKFTTEKDHLEPEFIWFLSKKTFSEGIKKIILSTK